MNLNDNNIRRWIYLNFQKPENRYWVNEKFKWDLNIAKLHAAAKEYFSWKHDHGRLFLLFPNSSVAWRKIFNMDISEREKQQLWRYEMIDKWI